MMYRLGNLLISSPTVCIILSMKGPRTAQSANEVISSEWRNTSNLDFKIALAMHKASGWHAVQRSASSNVTKLSRYFAWKEDNPVFEIVICIPRAGPMRSDAIFNTSPQIGEYSAYLLIRVASAYLAFAWKPSRNSITAVRTGGHTHVTTSDIVHISRLLLQHYLMFRNFTGVRAKNQCMFIINQHCV